LDRHLDQPAGGRPLRDVVFAPDGSPHAALLDDQRYVQASLFALEVALYRLLESFGVRADLLAGHSVGELAAAHVAGGVGRAEAAAVVATRGSLMQQLPAGGTMVAVQAAEDEVLPLLAGAPGSVELAAVNGPSAVVLTGEEAAVLAVADTLAGRGRRTRRLRIGRALHSAHLDGVSARFHQAVRQAGPRPPGIPIASTLTGTLVEPELMSDPGYWVRQARDTGRFQAAVRARRAARAPALVARGRARP